ncbi:hypothetical protein MB84_15810 [Pandoraea oxalativorans]|uniref:Uncharacterized protein n=1 Tax=Pandoraea oxalativorans TaxID=573737 RepID=A0A0E3YCD5_9BURK|nr:hypothetical protein MB84_15810 [Pandoraea oxalativorans]
MEMVRHKGMITRPVTGIRMNGRRHHRRIGMPKITAIVTTVMLTTATTTTTTTMTMTMTMTPAAMA